MTEEQKKKCEEFIKLTISSFEVVNTYESMARDLVMYLAKVFNKDITKEKADYIVDEIIKNEPIQYGSGYEALAYIIERIGWITAEYFDSEENINNIDLYINGKFITEEQKKKCEGIINYYEEKYKKDFEKINTLGFHIDGQHTSPIVRMFGIIVAGISFFEFEFGQSEDYLNEYSEFLVKSNNIAGENIIDLTVALSEVFNRNMTKEEAEKLLFNKDIEEGYQGDWQSKYSDKFYKSTKEFEHIIEVYIKNSPFYNSELDTIFSFGMLPHNINLYMFIFESVGWAIVNYFDNGNKEEIKENENNKENKINNVVETTAKEKTMTKEEQKKKIEEIINSSEEKYKKSLEELLDNFHEGYVPSALLFHYGNMDTIFYYYNPISMLFGGMVPLSFILSQMEGVENEFFEFLGDSKDKTAEIIIDATVSLSEIFNKNITKEEAEKLLFIKNDTKEEKFGTAYLGKFCVFTEEFRKIIEEYEEDKYGIERVISAIANYFDNGNKEANKINKINKINNAVENTAKEKIMSNNDELTLNLLILGQTGVGKSSLINALVGEEVAKVSDAEPQTDDIYEHPAEIDGKKIIIHDSWGMEVGKEKIWDDIINKKLKEKGIDKDIKDWFHSVTYCIQAGGNRIQDFDAEIITKFIKDKYNVIVALTKAEQMGKEDREKFIEKIKERIKKEIEKEEARNDININDIIVVSVSASPKKLDYMTEAPKPFGLPEYKAAILISWREIFINRIPVHIVKKLKEDIENAKSNAPKEGKDKELSNKIQEYFSNILNTNIQKHVRENIEKYYKINIDIFSASKNIKLSSKELNSDFYSGFNFTEDVIIDAFRYSTDSAEVIGAILALVVTSPVVIPLAILENVIVKPIEYLYHLIQGRRENIEYFINRVSDEYIEKIGTEEFESEIRQIIINALDEIDKKIIKLN